MAKLTARQIGLHLDEHNQLEHELIGDEIGHEHWEEQQDFDDWNRADGWGEPLDDCDYVYDPYPMPFDDLFDGEF